MTAIGSSRISHSSPRKTAWFRVIPAARYRCLPYIALVCFVLTHSGQLGAASENAITDAAADFKAQVTTKIMPYWYDTAVDWTNGGYLLSDDGSPKPPPAQEKQLVTQARMIWGFSRAHLAGLEYGKRDYLKAARQGYQFLLAHFLDRQNGGFFWTTDLSGNPVDRDKIVYGESFAIYGLVEYYRASHDAAALQQAMELYRTLQKRSHDPKFGGWIEHFGPDWTPMLEASPRAIVEVGGLKSANTHLHLMEALTSLYEVSHDPEVRASLEEAVRLNSTYFYPRDAGKSCFHRHLDWSEVTAPSSAGLSYGHNVEFAWLLLEADKALGREPEWNHFAAHLNHALRYGYDHERGGLFSRGFDDQPATNTDKIWWVQAEMLAALTDSLKHQPDPGCSNALEKLVQFITKFQANPADGIWLDTVTAEGRAKVPAKAHSWKANYHDVRALLKFTDAFAPSASMPHAAAAPAAALRPWRDYHTILWLGDKASQNLAKSPLVFQRMQEMGINTAMVYGDADPNPERASHFPYYVENIVNRGLCLKWNSKVRDWDKFVTDWAKNGRPESALVRDFCLDATDWRDWASREMRHVADKNRDLEPLAYNIRDELSTTISANPFDYDFSPTALSGFREWLHTQYSSLADLNREWETSFATWDDVKPFTTDEIKNRMASGLAQPRGRPDWQEVSHLRFEPAQAAKALTRWNLSPWSDFRSYMDLSLARALGDLAGAAHARDPHTPVGIEGTQMPSAFGGYDLWRLSQVLDWVEPYDIGNSREIFGSFMPGKPIITTVFEDKTEPALRRLWHLLLEGDRGCIVWWSEDCMDWNAADFPLTAKAKALAPALREMTSPLARLFLRATPERDPIYIHYSQPSIQVDWLLESLPDGSTWLRRFSSFEGEHNRQAKVRNAWVKLVQDLGFSPRFVSSEQIEQGALSHDGAAALVLPDSWALSDAEAKRIREFAGAGASPHLLLGEGIPGLFDGHGKLRAASPLGDWLPGVNANQQSWGYGAGAQAHGGAGFELAPSDILSFASGRLKSGDAPETVAWSRWAAGRLSGLKAPVEVAAADHVRTHRFQCGRAELLAFERNIDYHMSEDLKQAGGNQALETPIEVEAKLAKPAHLYDLRTGKYLGHRDSLRFTLSPWSPSLFAAAPEPLPADKVVEALAADK